MTREEAIEALEECVAWAEHTGRRYVNTVPADALKMAFEALKEEPRPTGKWVPYEFGDEKWHKCTNCNKPSDYKERVQHFDGKWYWYERVQNYCPNCGAQMESDTDGI